MFWRTDRKISNIKKYNYKKTKNKGTIEINSLEELMKLIKDVKNELVISKDEILIYDDYIEWGWKNDV